MRGHRLLAMLLLLLLLPKDLNWVVHGWTALLFYLEARPPHRRRRQRHWRRQGQLLPDLSSAREASKMMFERGVFRNRGPAGGVADGSTGRRGVAPLCLNETGCSSAWTNREQKANPPFLSLLFATSAGCATWRRRRVSGTPANPP